MSKHLINLYNEICVKIQYVLGLKDDACIDNYIDYVIIDNKEVDREWFLEQAKRIAYNSSYGGEVIDLSMIIVLKDGSWLERHEYDGSEWFEHKRTPKKPDLNAEKDIGIIFRDKHRCPFNETTLDGVKISKISFSKKYQIWLEKDGQIVVEEHEYDNGDYKPEHKHIL